MAYVLIFCLIVALIVLSIFVVMDMYGNKYILDMKDLPIDCDTVIILGAGIRPDGNPCDLLADRFSHTRRSISVSFMNRSPYFQSVPYLLLKALP